MHGHGYAPPPSRRPSNAALVTLRVVFAVLTVGSCGLLAFAPMLRLAIVTKKTVDWVLFVVTIVVSVGSLALIGAEPSDDLDTTQEWIGLFGVILTWIGVITYFLYADIKHFHGWTGPATAAYPAPQKQAYGYPPTAPTAYGQALPHQGVTAPLHPQQPLGAPQQPMAGPPLPQQPVPAPQQPLPTPPPLDRPANPQRPAPARIDQVRAELDELSSFLRGTDETSNGHDFPPAGRRPEDNR
ncbi:hypothetical protein [Streptomyces indicus]|uniref:Integral membrane protein n=1 Tax=Streptomyces indicus TaxID=417292 RepID=A0A1G9GUW3_9ACTN|nr:hypothetical protein [Streptomyces indicus]SDL04384.1 hypothetical protein SAMN05421806_11726 [Streptomyces indicus]